MAAEKIINKEYSNRFNSYKGREILPYAVTSFFINFFSILIDNYILIDSSKLIFLGVESNHEDISAGPSGKSDPNSNKTESVKILEKAKLIQESISSSDQIFAKKEDEENKSV